MYHLFVTTRDFSVLSILKQQGILASKIPKLGEEHEALQQQYDISKASELREAYREEGQDLLKLLYFVEINAVGLRKILKKFDKRLGYKLTDYYVRTRANHPYSELQQVLKQVGIGAVAEALSRNLHELQPRQGSYLSIYDQPNLPFQDHVIDSINAAVERLTSSMNFLNFGLTSSKIFSSVYFSAWSNKSYFGPLVFSSIVLFLLLRYFVILLLTPSQFGGT